MVAVLTAHSGLRPEAKRYIMAGRGVVVDAGGRGDYTTVSDAVDYMKARALAGRVWVREGLYQESATIAQPRLTVEGASWSTTVDGGTTGHAFDVTATIVQIMNLEVKTTGGIGNSYYGVNGNTGSDMLRVERVFCSDSDGQGVHFGADGGQICFSRVTGADNNGVNFGSAGDNGRVIANFIGSNGGWGTGEHTSAENIVYVGNRVTGNSSGQIQQASGTGTYAGNDET